MTARAERAIANLPRGDAEAVLEFILGPLKGNPQRVGSHLLYEPFIGFWRAKRGTTGSAT